MRNDFKDLMEKFGDTSKRPVWSFRCSGGIERTLTV
jgi:hypothetical protein